MIKTENAGILEAIREVKFMSLSKRLRLHYEAHMKDVRDRKAREKYVRMEGEKKGFEDGMQKLYINHITPPKPHMLIENHVYG